MNDKIDHLIKEIDSGRVEVKNLPQKRPIEDSATVKKEHKKIPDDPGEIEAFENADSRIGRREKCAHGKIGIYDKTIQEDRGQSREDQV